MAYITTCNKTYRGHERQIESVVQKAVTARIINLSVRDICNAAKISRQTFYAHYNGVNDVQKLQERRLQDEFKQRIGIITKREVIFTIMLCFIKDNLDYFSAALGRKDLRLLTWMIDYVRPRLVPSDITEYSYCQYRSSLKSLIQIWVTVDKSAKHRLSFYADGLLRLRVMRSRLDDARSFVKPAI